MSKVKRKLFMRMMIALVCVIVLLVVSSKLWFLFEGDRPELILEMPYQYIGVSQKIKLSVTDQGTGIRKVWAAIFKDGNEINLIDKEIGSEGFLRGSSVYEETFDIQLNPHELGLTDGNAVVRVVVFDYSWRGLLKGNKAYVQKEVVIDTRAPDIEILSSAHNINQGGSGLVIYKISENVSQSGVMIDNNLFPGYSGHFSDANIMMAFFALNYQQDDKTELFLTAIDQAGNTTNAGFSHHINAKVFKKDSINISDNFLRMKMPEFNVGDNQLSGIEKFLYINKELRKRNSDKVKEITRETDAVLYWGDRFVRFPNSATRATFGDLRSYRYKERVVDHQTHLGIDLASVARAPVPAANKGKIIFTGSIGIFGKTVIIDHGFGLYSMYSHLSQISVEKGQIVSRKQIIGRSGMTGMAGGDHLHFSMLVHNTFVNPVEWWDENWIKNNITSKINAVPSRVN